MIPHSLIGIAERSEKSLLFLVFFGKRRTDGGKSAGHLNTAAPEKVCHGTDLVLVHKNRSPERLKIDLVDTDIFFYEVILFFESLQIHPVEDLRNAVNRHFEIIKVSHDNGASIFRRTG